MSEPSERESLEVDVLFVGAGPATLSGALHLMNSIEQHNARAEKGEGEPIEPPTVLVIEKGANVGDHMLSGAVMNPNAIRELVPNFAEEGFPTEHVCTAARTIMFTDKLALTLPINPPQFEKKGYHVISLNKVAKWLAERCEAAGIEIYPGFAGDELLVDGGRVVGVRTGDMGVDKEGRQKSNFQPGMDIFAKVTVLGEGVRGTLSEQLIHRFELQGANPQTYGTGIKEIWRVKPERHKPGRVVHGVGFPNYLDALGGMWLYDLQDDLVSFGFVTYLDCESPYTDPHYYAQKMKTHPGMRKILEGGELVRYGAKCLPAGGLTAQPKFYADGALVIGDAAGFLNAERLAGVHQAIKSGMIAAKTIVEALVAKDFTSRTLGNFTEKYRDSWAYQEHWKSRNFHSSWEKGGGAFFTINTPVRMITGGRGLIDPIATRPVHEHMKKLSELPPAGRVPTELEFDGVYTFSKEHLVQFSGTQHEVDQPSHLVVADTDLCSTTCAEEYGNPCESFCPAAVYEMIPDPAEEGRKKLVIHHENCVHCKTCDIADPYQVITWTPPEGGEGPDYNQM
jgi:electron-transferring-flavoprotein dehydrogenase